MPCGLVTETSRGPRLSFVRLHRTRHATNTCTQRQNMYTCAHMHTCTCTHNQIFFQEVVYVTPVLEIIHAYTFIATTPTQTHRWADSLVRVLVDPCHPFVSPSCGSVMNSNEWRTIIIYRRVHIWLLLTFWSISSQYIWYCSSFCCMYSHVAPLSSTK